MENIKKGEVMIKYLIFEEERTSIYMMYNKMIVNESFYKTINDILKYYLIDLTSYNKNYRRKFESSYLIPIYIKNNLCLVPFNGIKSGGPVINYYAIKNYSFSNNEMDIIWKDDTKTSFNIKRDKWNTLQKRTKRVIDLYM